MSQHQRLLGLLVLAWAACATSCWAAGWQIQLRGGSLQGAAYDGTPVIAAISRPLAGAEIEWPLAASDTAIALGSGWRVLAGPADAVWTGPAAVVASKPATLEWTFMVETPGPRSAWLLARHSEVGPDGRDLADAYDVTVDGKPLRGEWGRLAVRNFGNAWFGWLDLGIADLPAGEHRLRVATKRNWCFLDQLRLVAPGADPVAFADEMASMRTKATRTRSGVEIESESGPLQILQRVEPAGDALRLSGRLRWQGEPTLLRGIVWRVPIEMGETASAAFPGSLPPGEQPVPRAPRSIGPRMGSPLVILRDGTGHAVSALGYSTTSQADLTVTRTHDGVTLEVRCDTYGRLKPGDEVDLGQVLVASTRGDLWQAADAFQHLYRAAGLRPPPNRADWAQDLAIYCAHPGGPIERGFARPGGFREFAQRLPDLARMGATALWLLPIFEHGPHPGSIYGPVDQFAPSSRLGTPQDLKALVEAAHRLGVKVFFDFVPHGPPEQSALAAKFADAICLDEDGRRKTRWGWSFDYANPRWQQYLHDAAAHNARAFGIDGARIDVFPGDGNWDPRVPYLASYPIVGGGMEMARAIRSGIAGVGGRAFVVPEDYAVRPPAWSVGDAAYDAGLYFLLEDLAHRDPPPDEWASTLSGWMELQGRALPSWALEMRFTANHDTVSSVFLKARPAVAFGYERSHALAAICALARGIPMIYEGEEDPTLWGGKFPSSVEFYGRLWGLRRSLEPLRRGAAGYRAVRASPGVWTCLRRADKAWALGVVSLWPEPREVWLSLPAGLRAAALKDAFGGAALTLGGRRVRLRLPACGVAVLTPEG